MAKPPPPTDRAQGGYTSGPLDLVGEIGCGLRVSSGTKPSPELLRAINALSASDSAAALDTARTALLVLLDNNQE